MSFLPIISKLHLHTTSLNQLSGCRRREAWRHAAGPPPLQAARGRQSARWSAWPCCNGWSLCRSGPWSWRPERRSTPPERQGYTACAAGKSKKIGIWTHNLSKKCLWPLTHFKLVFYLWFLYKLVEGKTFAVFQCLLMFISKETNREAWQWQNLRGPNYYFFLLLMMQTAEWGYELSHAANV